MNHVKKDAGEKDQIIVKNSQKQIAAHSVTKGDASDHNPENVAICFVRVDAQDLNNLIAW